MARTVEAILKANVGSFVADINNAAAAMDKLAARAAAAGAKVDASLSGAGRSSSKLGSSTSGLANSEQHLSRLSRGFALAGAAVTGGLLVIGKATADFDQAMSHVAATGTDAAQQLDGLRKAAIDAGAATAFSARESAQAEEELIKAGVGATDVLQGGLTGALNLAAAGSLDVASAANIAATAMSQFEMNGAQVPHIADLLAAAAGKAQGSVQDMGTALNYVGPVAHAMGISIEQTVGTLAEFANAGIVGEQGGTALRGVLLSLTSPSVQATKTMQKLGISMYDANGKFVGLDGAAQQLQDGFTGLTEAERNAALGRIFGNAQVTAATVLYKGGADSVNNWTKKVNDSGFAARQAATKMDNLKGDIEKLSGSLQSAFIGVGEGAQGGLRGMVQTVESAVDAFNKLSPATKSAVGAIAAIGAAGLLGVAGIMRLAVGISEARTAMTALQLSSPRLAGAIGAIGKAGLVAAGALIALEVAGAAAKTFHGVLTPNITEAKTALESLRKTGDATDLNKMFEIKSLGTFGQVTTQVDSLGSAFQALGRENWTDRLNGQIDSMLGTTESAFTQMRVQFTALDKSLIGLSSAGHADVAAQQFAKIAEQAKLQQFPVERLIELFPQYRDSVIAAAESSGVANLAGQELADAMGGKLSPALEKAMQSAGKLPATYQSAAMAALNFGSAMNQMLHPMQLTAEQSQQLAQGLFAEGNAMQNTVSAHSAYAQSLHDANKALGAHSLSIDKDTGLLKDNNTAQREAGAAIGNIATQGKAYVQSLVAQGASSKQAAAATADVRREFILAADAAGLSRGEARKLADAYGLVPDQVSTTFQAFGLALMDAQVADYGKRIMALPKKAQAEITAIYNDKGPKAAEAALRRFEGRKATATVTAKSNVKPVVDKANALLKGIKDAKPGIKPTSTAAAVSRSASRFLNAIKDVSPKVSAKQNANIIARAAQRFLNSVKDVDPRILAKTNAGAVAAYARRVMNVPDTSATIHINTVRSTTIKVHRQGVGPGSLKGGSTIGGATGGFIRGRDIVRRAEGGPVAGAGSGTSDSIDAKLSNGEFVIRAAAVKVIGVDELFRLNSLGGPQRPSTDPNGYAAGGTVKVGNTTIDIAIIQRLIAALNNPLAQVAAATRAVAVAQKQLNDANRVAAGPRRTRDRAAAAYKDARDDRDAQRALLVRLKKQADATKGVTAADRLYKKEQHDLAVINLRVTKTSKENTAAAAAYAKVADKVKAATDKLKTAQQALAAQQQAVADTARQVASTLRGAADTTSTDPVDLLSKRVEETKRLVDFQKQLLALRKAGLNDTDIQGIVDRGALDGGELAAAILKGGKAMVAALNTAQKNLDAAANAVGYTAATGVVKRAGGGWIDGPTGGTDQLHLAATRGEYVVQEDRAKEWSGLLEAINSGTMSQQFVKGMQAYGNPGGSYRSQPVSRSQSISVPVTIGQIGLSERNVASRIQGKVLDGLNMAGVTASGIN